MSDAEGLALNFLSKARDGLPEGGLIAQYGGADACELVGERAGGLVVIGTHLELDGPSADARERSSLG